MSYVKEALINAREGRFDPFVELLAVTESQGAKFGVKEEKFNVGGRMVTMAEIDQADMPEEEEEND